MSNLKSITIKEWLADTKSKLDSVKIESKLNTSNTRLDVEILLLEALNKDKIFLYTDSDYILSENEIIKLNNLLDRRIKGEPIAYIIGHKEFWSLNFKVTPDVLIPRPDTELLVEQVLKYLPKDKNCHVADIGTGSGAIAIALAKERPNWKIHAVDLSSRALKIAKENAISNKVSNIKFYHADLLSGFNNISFKFDAIVSNPPYIDENDEYITDINAIELNYEPRMALVARNLGLEIIERLVKQSKEYLLSDGMLFIEHGYKQKNLIISMIESEVKIEFSKFIKDLNHLNRLLIVKF